MYVKTVSSKNITTVGLAPDMIMSKECHYKKAYIRTVLRMKEFCNIVDMQRNRIMQLEQQLNPNNNNQCSCNNPQHGNGRPQDYVPGRQTVR